MRELEKYIGEEFAKLKLDKTAENCFSGVRFLSVFEDGISGLEVTVEEENSLGRKKGNYFTFDLPNFSYNSQNKMVAVLAKTIRKVLPKKLQSVLVLGMGNEYIISDSLGTKTVDSLNVLEMMERRDGLRVYKFCPSVFAVSGFESYDLCRAVVEVADADLVIVVDSLCTKTNSRLGKSFQISDAGIVPGSAVGSQVCDLSSVTLNGAKVISIGVPVVIYLQSVVEEVIKKIHPQTLKDFGGAVNNFDNLDAIFSPKDIDFLVEISSRIVSRAIFEALTI